MKKAEVVSGKKQNRRKRKLPKKPVASAFSRPPKGLPIDFYDKDWYNNLQPAQKEAIVNAEEVAFLKDPRKSILGKRHPDEKLGDKKFSERFVAEFTEGYEIPARSENGEDNGEEDTVDVDDPDTDYGSSLDLEDAGEDDEFFGESEFEDGEEAFEGEAMDVDEDEEIL